MSHKLITNANCITHKWILHFTSIWSTSNTNFPNIFKDICFILSRQSGQVFSVSFAHFLYLGRPTTLAEIMGKAEMWLIRSYWDLEFPHPISPNVDYIGGLHCKPAKPLPKVNTFFSSFSFHILSDKMILHLSSKDRDIWEMEVRILLSIRSWTFG